MAYANDYQPSPAPLLATNRWVEEIGLWFQVRRRKQARNRGIQKLHLHDERMLEDMGLARSQLVAELGYDPRDQTGLFGKAAFRIPHQ